MSTRFFREAVAKAKLPQIRLHDKADQYYFHNFWINLYTPTGGSLMYFGTFVGWGGNITVLMPKGMTGIRFAKVWDSALDYENPVGMLAVADRLGAFTP